MGEKLAGDAKGLVREAATKLDLSKLAESGRAIAGQQQANELEKKVRDLHSAGRYPEAITVAQQILAIRENAIGRDHPDLATSLNALAFLYTNVGRHADAEPLYQRSLAIYERAFGRDHPDVAMTLSNLGRLYSEWGRYADAEPFFQRSLLLREKALGREHPGVAQPLNDLALLYHNQGRYAEAEPLYQRSLALREKALGRDHPDVAQSLHNLAGLYENQGRYSDAEPLVERSLAVFEKAFGRDHPDVALSLNNLAGLYIKQGRYADAERLYQRSLAITEKTVGRDHPRFATSLNNLAVLYKNQDRYDMAEALHQRALAIHEKASGRDHPDVALSLNNLALLYFSQGRYDEAEPLYQRSLEIREKALGRDHPDVALSLNNLAGLYERQDRYAEAEHLYQQSLAIVEKVLGRDHPDAAISLNNLATLYQSQRRFAEAEAWHQRSLSIREKALGRNHPDVAASLHNMAGLYRDQRRYVEALTYSRRAIASVIAHATGEAGLRRKEGVGALIEQDRVYFAVHLANLAAYERTKPETALGSEALITAQWANLSAAAAAVQQLGLRFASGSGALAALVRERQDLSVLWHAHEKALITALSKSQGEPKLTLTESIRKQIAETERKLAANAARLTADFPDYAALANPKPLRVEDAQNILGPNEVLVVFFAGVSEMFVFALTRERLEWKSIPLPEEALDRKVIEFRRGLDVDALHRGLVRAECTQAQANSRGLSRSACGRVVAKECEEASMRGLARDDCKPTDGPRELFDVALAHELYGTLIGPVEGLVKDKKHLIIVPSGPLTALPFHLLVTEKPALAVPQVKTPRDLAAYRDTAWLLRRHAVSVLPSVASLQALRVFARKEQGSKPLIGFGDPVFSADDESKSVPAERVATRSYSEFWQGIGVDRAQLRRAARLPETAVELQAVAKNLGAPASDIHLRLAASEATVKRLPLADYRVVYFATHGLVAGEVKGLGEPSLLLTLPKEPSETDDGLLTASEVAQLKLNADWVVLSACNTIAGDKPGAEALSGLARAFFYAGARALLVSHWAVESNAATALTTSTFDILKADPSLGRAEALRRAMLGTMNDASNPYYAYPAYWAPFVVVGEGAAR